MLDAAQFEAFYRDVYGRDPFPWQVRLARQVVETGDFPAALDLPTGSGKTSLLDVALFSLAASAAGLPRRVVLVVDRRIIVAQAAQHASRLRTKLGNAPPGTAARRVAEGLRTLWGGAEHEPPFGVAELRGGVPRDTAWADRPDRPMVVVSTVDQVGSRLLFRGYGVTPAARPIHAALLGNDVLYLLDEVHLSVPFAETLRSVARWRERAAATPLRRPFAVVAMSATLGPLLERDGSAQAPFALDERDRADPRLAPRLHASKPARLELVKVSGKDEKAKLRSLAVACAGEAVAALTAGARRVAIVVNRVETARVAAQTLAATEALAADVQLVTGRMRPLDRDRLFALEGPLMPRLEARPGGRDPAARPLVVVATQCIEAGADFDVDALVTECASLDALRQRFGRLDRLGELGGTARAVILQRSDATKDDADDPVYGRAAAETWRWLTEVATGGVVDFGIEWLPEPPPERRAQLVAPTSPAPILLPDHLDLWARTNPAPEPDPDVALWLHGPRRRVDDVQVIWRADLAEDDLDAHGESAAPSERLLDLMAACPPSSLEAIALPIWAVRAWLRGDAEAPVADVPMAADEAAPRRPAERATSRRMLIWRGEGASVVASAKDVRPGDTVVVPASRGGVRLANWDPGASEPVEDLGDLAQWHQRGRATLRLGPARPAWVDAVGSPDWSSEDPDEALASWLSSVDLSQLPVDWRKPLAELAGGATNGAALRRRTRLIRIGERENELPVLVARRRAPAPSSGEDRAELSTEGDRGSFVAREVKLREHLADVAAYVHALASRLGLDPQLVSDLELAALCHDLGKADPRFQLWLAGGNQVRHAGLEEPLAKSGGVPTDRRARQLARERAGYPPGERHELLSVTLAEPLIRERAADPELVRHLVASHHGWCRPLAPPVHGSSPELASIDHLGVALTAPVSHGLSRLDSGVPARFADLSTRYGNWGLALLEALLRLADHRVSAGDELAEQGTNSHV